jgi:hypothetical protein
MTSSHTSLRTRLVMRNQVSPIRLAGIHPSNVFLDIPLHITSADNLETPAWLTSIETHLHLVYHLLPVIVTEVYTPFTIPCITD